MSNEQGRTRRSQRGRGVMGECPPDRKMNKFVMIKKLKVRIVPPQSGMKEWICKGDVKTQWMNIGIVCIVSIT